MDKYRGYIESPIGVIEVVGNDEAILSVEFVDCIKENNENSIVTDCINQLDEYFKGTRKTFQVNVVYDGTSFQNSVWKALSEIQYGQLVSYKDIAQKINNEKAVRAVGGANNKNKISIILPCHRVIGKNGQLVGYGGGVWRKEWLINHEKENRHDV